MCRVGQECRLITLDQMSQPGKREGRWYEQKADDPVKPNYDYGRKTYRNRDHMQCPIHRMIVCAIIVRLESHLSPRSPRFRGRIIARKRRGSPESRSRRMSSRDGGVR